MWSSHGTLHFDVPQKAGEPRNPHSNSKLVVKHATLVDDVADARKFWQIDSAECETHPPAVQISLVGKSDVFPYLRLAYYNSYTTENQAARKIACDGNVCMYR